MNDLGTIRHPHEWDELEEDGGWGEPCQAEDAHTPPGKDLRFASRLLRGLLDRVGSSHLRANLKS